MEKINGYWTDENGNRWNGNFYSEKAVLKKYNKNHGYVKAIKIVRTIRKMEAAE